MLLQIENITLTNATQVFSAQSFTATGSGKYNLSIAGGDIDYVSGTYNGYDGAIFVRVYKNTLFENAITFITTSLFPLSNLEIDLDFGVVG